MNWQASPTSTVPDGSGHGSVGAARPQSQHIDPDALLRGLVGEQPERLVHVHEVPARTASLADWPEWVDPTVLGALLGSVSQYVAARAPRPVVVIRTATTRTSRDLGPDADGNAP